HRIEVLRPAQPAFPQTAILVISGGEPSTNASSIGMALAGKIGCTVVTLYNEPNQPLFGGKTEDALVAYTFKQYLETHDPTWPLLLPMTKSAVRAMDATQAFLKQEFGSDIRNFVVTGASKRGWTTWLTGAVDPVRVSAIVPIVYDNLNIPAQIQHQIDTMGHTNAAIGDYTRLNLFTNAHTDPNMQNLINLVDPWVYRSSLTMPKLIINATNDPFWTIDSLNIYWDGLPAPKYVLYVPNAGHGLNSGDHSIAGIMQAANTMDAFARCVASHQPLPPMQWSVRADQDTTWRMVIDAPQGVSARLWVAQAATRDFHQSHWTSLPLEREGNRFTGTIHLPQSGYTGIIGEVSLTSCGVTHDLSTQVFIFDQHGVVSPVPPVP
ncbi:MAG TPA: PhoPQ-activated protein PqaA family protein, partial [Armatimonadota bacterium]|nr:PhoPQ-activated protein PqaA family protein [Armatimonadota bacterium]